MALALFTLVATMLFHPFWRGNGEERAAHVTVALTSSSRIGALLLVIATS